MDSEKYSAHNSSPVRPDAAGVQKKLRADKEAAELAYKLVTLKNDVDLGFTTKQLKNKTLWTGPKESDAFFEKLNFNGSVQPLRKQFESY